MLSTFDKVRRLALAGDPQAQNLAGFMSFFGEGAPASRELAGDWFRRAAAQGHAPAQLNLALMYYLGAGERRDRAQGERYFRLAAANANKSPDLATRLVIRTLPELAHVSCRGSDSQGPMGETTYVVYCAGCHGLNGIAAYGGSPSFALGERLDKGDAELLQSIVEGHGVMPTWGDKLPGENLGAALRFVRQLERDFQSGVLHVLRLPPPLSYRFGPMSSDFQNIPYATPNLPAYQEQVEAFTRLCSSDR